jgi:signal transduction histidine kinase
MLMPASTEFITLCRTQVALLVDGFGASLSAIYLTEDPTTESETALVPLVVYPEERDLWPETVPLALPQSLNSRAAFSIPTYAFGPATTLQALPPSKAETEPMMPTDRLALTDDPEPIRMMFPLLHNDMVWGLMVVGRERRQWSKREQSQLEQVAHTLAIACVLDQRSQWLAQARDRRQLLQAQQDTTLSTLLHQFRNPLTTLRTLGKLLTRRLNPSDSNRNLAESIVSESNHLEQLLKQFDDAIDLGDASLESEEVGLTEPHALVPSSNWLTGSALTLQPCWLSEILGPLLHSMAGRADEKTMRLHVSIPKDLPPVKADATALREVFGNLMDNALKYTPEGGDIWVSVEHLPQQFQQRVQISDTGPGIPAEDLERVFERTYRGVQAQTDIPGTGLGLAIARDLISQMGGTIEAQSPVLMREGVDEMGSTFSVQLTEYSDSNSNS